MLNKTSYTGIIHFFVGPEINFIFDGYIWLGLSAVEIIIYCLILHDNNIRTATNVIVLFRRSDRGTTRIKTKRTYADLANIKNRPRIVVVLLSQSTMEIILYDLKPQKSRIINYIIYIHTYMRVSSDSMLQVYVIKE